MKSLQELEEDGIDIDGAMERFMNNEEMFRHFLRELPEDEIYCLLMEAFDAGDVDKAFDLAHQLKGIIANLSLSFLYQTMHDIVEILREKRLPHEECRKHFSEIYEQTMEYIRKEV